MNLLVWLSGANPDILDKCQTDLPKYAGLGGVVLTTGVLAGISCAVALQIAARAHVGVVCGRGRNPTLSRMRPGFGEA